MSQRGLLLSGGVNDAFNHPRYENDIRAFYRLLVRSYGYAAADLRVCEGRGGTRRLHGDAPVLVEPARRPNVLAALDWLSELGEGDRIFVMVTDHGEPEGICLWGSAQRLTPDDIAQRLARSAATKVLVFGQCYGGRFGEMQLGRTVICSARDGSSYPVPAPAPGVERPYNEFLYQFAGALEGEYPDGVPFPGERRHLVPPGGLSVGEAFKLARDHDRWITGTRAVQELPRMFDPESLADQIRL